MKILKLLNKIYFSIIFVLLLGLNSYADDKPVDIWNIDNSDNKKEINSIDKNITKKEKEKKKRLTFIVCSLKKLQISLN